MQASLDPKKNLTISTEGLQPTSPVSVVVCDSQRNSVIPCGNSPEEQQLSRFYADQLINPFGYIDFSRIPAITIPAFTLEMALPLRTFFCTPYKLQGILTPDQKKKIVAAINSPKFRKENQNLSDAKIEKFLRHHYLQNLNKESAFSHEITPGRLMLRQLERGHLEQFILRGGRLRQLLLPWFELVIQRNMDPSFTLAPKKRSQLATDPPDWDFVLYFPSAEHLDLLKLNDAMMQDVCECIFGKADADLAPLYLLLTQHMACKFVSYFPEGKSQNCLTIGKGFEIVTSNQPNYKMAFSYQFFELTISKFGLKQWLEQPTRPVAEIESHLRLNITPETYRIGLQSTFDIVFGFLHEERDFGKEKDFALYHNWLTKGYRSPQNLSRALVNHLIKSYFPRLISQGKKAGLDDLLIQCHRAHHKNDLQALRALVINAFLTLRRNADALHPYANTSKDMGDEIIKESWKGIKSAIALVIPKTAETLLDRLILMLDRDIAYFDLALSALELFSFIQACATSNPDAPLSVDLSSHEGRAVLQVNAQKTLILPCDPLTALTTFEKLWSSRTLHSSAMQMLQTTCEQFLDGFVLDPNNQIKRNEPLLGIPWPLLENAALRLCNSNDRLVKTIGYHLLLVSPHLILDRIRYFLHLRTATNHTCFAQNLQISFASTPYAEPIQRALNQMGGETPENQVSSFIALLMCSDHPELKRQAYSLWKYALESTPDPQERAHLGEQVLQWLLPFDFNLALKTFSDLQETRCFSQQQERKQFQDILNTAFARQRDPAMIGNISLLGKAATEILASEPQQEAPVKRRGNPKKHAPRAPAQETFTWNCAQALNWLILKIFENPTEEAFVLLSNATRARAIPPNNGTAASLWLKCFEKLVTHPSRNMQVIARLWEEAAALKIRMLEGEIPNRVALVASLYISLPILQNPATIAIFESLLESMCQEQGENTPSADLATVAKNYLDGLLLEKRREEALRWLDNVFKRVLPRECRTDYCLRILELEFEAKNITTIITLLKRPDFPSRDQSRQIGRLLSLCSENTERTLLLDVLALALNSLKGQETPDDLFIVQILNLLKIILGRLYSPQMSLPKQIKEEVQNGFSILLKALKRGNHPEEVIQLIHLMHLQGLLPALEGENCQIFIGSCKGCLNNSPSPQLISSIDEILNALKYFEGAHPTVSIEEQVEVYGMLSSAMPRTSRAFDWMLRSLSLVARATSPVPAAPSSASIAQCASDFRLHCDVFPLLIQAFSCPGYHSDPILNRECCSLVGQEGYAERSARILIDHSNRVISEENTLNGSVEKTVSELIMNANETRLRLAYDVMLRYALSPDLVGKIFHAINTAQNATAFKNELWNIYQATQLIRGKYPPSIKGYMLIKIADILRKLNSPALYQILLAHETFIPLFTDEASQDIHLFLFILIIGSSEWIAEQVPQKQQSERFLEILALRKQYLTRLQQDPENLNEMNYQLLMILANRPHGLLVPCTHELAREYFQANEQNLDAIKKCIQELLTLLSDQFPYLSFTLYLIQEMRRLLAAKRNIIFLLFHLYKQNDPEILQEAAKTLKVLMDHHTPPDPIDATMSLTVKNILVFSFFWGKNTLPEDAAIVLQHPQIKKWLTKKNHAEVMGPYLLMLLAFANRERQIERHSAFVQSFTDNLEVLSEDELTLVCCWERALEARLQIFYDNIPPEERNPDTSTAQSQQAVLEKLLELRKWIEQFLRLTTQLTVNLEAPLSPKEEQERIKQFFQNISNLIDVAESPQVLFNNLTSIIQRDITNANKEKKNPAQQGLVQLEFPNDVLRQRFFKLQKLLLLVILRSHPPILLIAKRLLIYAEVEIRILMSHFPEKTEDLMELIEAFVFTHSEHFLEAPTPAIFHNFMNKALESMPLLLRNHPKRIFSILLFLYPREFAFPRLSTSEMQEVTCQTALKLTQPTQHNSIWTKRACDILNSVPASLMLQTPPQLTLCYKRLIDAMCSDPFHMFQCRVVHLERLNSVSVPLALFNFIGCQLLDESFLFAMYKDKDVKKAQMWTRIGFDIYVYYLEALMIIEAVATTRDFDLPKRGIEFLEKVCNKLDIEPYYEDLIPVVIKLSNILLKAIASSEDPEKAARHYDLCSFFLLRLKKLTTSAKMARVNLIGEWTRQLVNLNIRAITAICQDRYMRYAKELGLEQEFNQKHHSILQLFPR